MANEGAVAPQLLDYVAEYVDETDLSSALADDFDSDSNLIVFCRELFAQLFANVVGEAITTISSTSAQRANVLRRKHGRTWGAPLRRLVGHFQEFCKIYTDLLERDIAAAAKPATSSSSTICPRSCMIWRSGPEKWERMIFRRALRRFVKPTMGFSQAGSQTQMTRRDTDLHSDLLAELEENSDREKQLVELIRLDYDATLRAISGFVGAAAQMRGIGIAAWGVVLGLAVRDESAPLAGLALGLVVLFAYADAFHSALYRRALSRAIGLEGLLDSYLDRLGISAEDAEAILRTRAKLETHRFGMYRTFRPLAWRDLLSARPRPILWTLYPTLFVVSVVILLVYAF
jgi:hypothetical protein